MALLKITHFWSNLLEWGYQHNFLIWGYQHTLQFYGSVGLLECTFMALLTLSNEGLQLRGTSTLSSPMMRLPNVKCCSVSPLECKFMALLKITHFWSNSLAWGYQHNFPTWGYQHNFPIWGYQHNFLNLAWLPLVR